MTENGPTYYDEDGYPLPPKKPVMQPPTLPGSCVVNYTPEPVDELVTRQSDPKVQAHLLAAYRRDAAFGRGSAPDFEESAEEWGLNLGPDDSSW